MRWSRIAPQLALTPALMLAKAAIIYLLSRAFGETGNTATRVSGLLAQGPCAFLFIFLCQQNLMDHREAKEFLKAHIHCYPRKF